jgi:hypothetical protein
MSEIKTEIKQNPDGNYTITDAHSTADVVRWLLTQDSKETILYLLGDTPQRTWVGLTEWEREAIAVECGAMSVDWLVFMEAVEKALKEKNL